MHTKEFRADGLPLQHNPISVRSPMTHRHRIIVSGSLPSARLAGPYRDPFV
jgi:hypothetical protein